MRYLIIPFILLSILGCTNSKISPPLSPQSELATFQLDDQLTIELVASEPIVQDPVAMSFDEDGRLWVLEMRSFMPDIDGNGEEQPLGRVKVLVDTNQDGHMDVDHIFLDSLTLPRAIACTNGGILIAEQKPLWFAKDTNGDFRADIKTLVDSTYGGRGFIEHSPNGLWRGMDNWFYNAKADFRYKYASGKWIKEETEFRGQWGICHDDVGRLFYNYNWSQLHADLVPPNYFYQNPHHTPTSGIDHGLTLNRSVYPIRSNTAVNRGYVPGTLDEEGKLLEFASACSPLVFRGDAMSDTFYGNAFVCEPTANLIKRNILNEWELIIEASEAYDKKEFLASTDERFRPVFLASGPDGALYIADMYRGIIQHGPYMTSYLREETLKRGLDRPINLGRIWRIKQKDKQTQPALQLSKMSSQELVVLLSSPNGWYRDVAQRLLVEQNAPNTIPLLENILKTSPDALARLHALWTMEGLRNTNSDIYFYALEDSDPYVQCAAIRLLESLATKDEKLKTELLQALYDLVDNVSYPVQLQTLLSSRIFAPKDGIDLCAKLLFHIGDTPIDKDALISSLTNREYQMLVRMWADPDWEKSNLGKDIFVEMLVRAIINKGDTQEILALLDKLNSPNPEWQSEAIVNGMLTHNRSPEAGLISLLTEPQVFKDTSQAYFSTLNHLFSWPGKKVQASLETDSIQTDPQIMALGRQQYLTVCAACHGSDGKGLKRFAPPLANSEWVLGNEKQLILLILQGMQGPVSVNGKQYDVPDILPQMPSFSTLDNGDLAAIMTYIRQSWGNRAEPVNAGRVGHIRYRSQGKLVPWTAEELEAVSDEEIE